ncbi:hypothetical protein N9L45_01470 [Planctomycetota bacterium]|nr:hypothetical protein [Planctomycetota bacterium]
MSTPSSGFDSPTLTVPAGRIFVLTGVCCSDVEFNGSATIAIDGVDRRFELRRGNDFRNDAMIFSGGVPLVGGQTIQVRRGSSGYTWLHGYWADA